MTLNKLTKKQLLEHIIKSKLDRMKKVKGNLDNTNKEMTEFIKTTLKGYSKSDLIIYIEDKL